MSHFTFLQAEWPEVHEAAAKAEAFAPFRAFAPLATAERALRPSGRPCFCHKKHILFVSKP